MKKTRLAALLLAMLFLCACSTASPADSDTASASETAVYNEDTTLGDGSKVLTVKVTDTEKTVTFTINTDAKTVGEALSEHNLIAGENGQFGLYIKVVNGTRADFDKDGAYWGFYDKDGGYMNSGADTTDIKNGDIYELKYTKG